jgi:hypothetical protein
LFSGIGRVCAIVLDFDDDLSTRTSINSLLLQLEIRRPVPVQHLLALVLIEVGIGQKFRTSY